MAFLKSWFSHTFCIVQLEYMQCMKCTLAANADIIVARVAIRRGCYFYCIVFCDYTAT